MLRLRSMPALTKIHFTNGEDMFVAEPIQDISFATNNGTGFTVLTLHDGREVRVNLAHAISYLTVPEPGRMPPGAFGT